MVNSMEQYKKAEGESIMNVERLNNLAERIIEMRKINPELGIMTAFLYHLSKEDKEGLGEEEIGKILRIVKKKEDDERKEKAIAKLKEGKRNIITSRQMRSLLGQSEKFEKRHPQD